MAKTTRRQTGLILASTSTIRKTLLRRAGIDFVCQRPDVDEAAIIAAAGSITAAQTSAMLARLKALSVDHATDALIIGCDQALEFEGRVYGKARTMKEAHQRLEAFAGKTHYLAGTCVLASGGRIVWRHYNRAAMHMRPLDQAAITAYLKRAGPDILASVGCYQIEGLGITLMERMQGNYFSILGLPLLPLLNALRKRGVLW